MKKNALILIVFSIMLINLLTFLLILFFWDPFHWTITMQKMAFASFITTFIIFSSLFLGLIIYFLKKVWYRWDIYIKNIFSSIRQWFILSWSSVLFLYFNNINVLNYKTVALVLIIWTLIELTFKNLE